MSALSQKQPHEKTAQERLHELIQFNPSGEKLKRALQNNPELIPAVPDLLRKLKISAITRVIVKNFPEIQVECAKILLQQNPSAKDIYWIFWHVTNTRTEAWRVMPFDQLTPAQIVRFMIESPSRREGAWQALISREKSDYRNYAMPTAFRRVMATCPDYRKQAAEKLIEWEPKNVQCLKDIMEEYPDLELRALLKICQIITPKNTNCWVAQKIAGYDQSTAEALILHIYSPVLLFAIAVHHEHLRLVAAQKLLRHHKYILYRETADQPKPETPLRENAVFWLAHNVPELREEFVILILKDVYCNLHRPAVRDILLTLPIEKRRELVEKHADQITWIDVIHKFGLL